MAIVSLVNQKGGVGETSTPMHLGGALARRGLRVLVADNDPQSSLTKGLLGVEAARALDLATTIYALYAELPCRQKSSFAPDRLRWPIAAGRIAAHRRFQRASASSS